MDTMTGDVITALRSAGLYDTTLVVLCADNGAPLQNGNNWPLKGGKWSNYEGGVRVNALVSGGFVPPSRRGTVETGLVAVEDWFATF